jgi:hypothetical protein
VANVTRSTSHVTPLLGACDAAAGSPRAVVAVSRCPADNLLAPATTISKDDEMLDLGRIR